MTTRNLRRLIDECSDIASHPNPPVDLRQLLVVAEAEVSAIERAARHLTENRARNRLAEYVSGGKDWAKACALMESIARETT